jgi:hypothetical protein
LRIEVRLQEALSAHGARVDVRLTGQTVEIPHHGRRVASHIRLYGRGLYQTDPAHRPAAHQRYLDWTPERLIHWAHEVGPHTAQLVESILRERPNPEHGYRTSERETLHLSRPTVQRLLRAASIGSPS